MIFLFLSPLSNKVTAFSNVQTLIYIAYFHMIQHLSSAHLYWIYRQTECIYIFFCLTLSSYPDNITITMRITALISLSPDERQIFTRDLPQIFACVLGTGEIVVRVVLRDSAQTASPVSRRRHQPRATETIQLVVRPTGPTVADFPCGRVSCLTSQPAVRDPTLTLPLNCKQKPECE